MDAYAVLLPRGTDRRSARYWVQRSFFSHRFAASGSAKYALCNRGPARQCQLQRIRSNFNELVACRRADGTLRSFADPNIAWRVRYFVRYWRMPCGEMPTIEEAYVFHMVTNDLYADDSLDDSQRLAIRTAMFDGTPHCR